MSAECVELGRQCREELLKAVTSAACKGKEFGSGKCGLILSGGVDTCAVAMAAAQSALVFDLAITVVISEDDEDQSVHKGTDEPYAVLIAKHFKIPHHIVRMTAMDLVLTGDAADELLGGYSFTWGSDDPEWSTKRANMVSSWYFSGPDMAAALGLGAHSPYMEESFVKWALGTTKNQCIAEAEIEAQPGDKREVHKAGKIPLRHAYPDAISAWRRKDPIEKGSGSVALSDAKFWERAALKLGAATKELTQAEGGLEQLLATVGAEGQVKLRDYEHLVYYREFQRQFPSGTLPSRERFGKDPCKSCGYQLRHSLELFCHTCGEYPAQDPKQ